MRAIPFSASGVVGPAVSASGGVTHLMGYIITENAGSPGAAVVNIRNQGVVTGAILLPVKLVASATAIVNFNEPLAVNGACYVEVNSGTVVGSLFIG